MRGVRVLLFVCLIENSFSLNTKKIMSIFSSSCLEPSFALELVCKEYPSLELLFNHTVVAKEAGECFAGHRRADKLGSACRSWQAHPHVFPAALMGKWFAYIILITKGSRNLRFVLALPQLLL